MKRILTLLLALLLAASFTACNSKDGEQSDANGQTPPAADSTGDAQAPPDDAPAGPAPAAPAGPAPAVKSESKYVLNYQGCDLPMNADFAPILAYLGEPVSYFEAESCAFDGLDKTYTYDAVEIVTYPDDGVDRVSSVRILTGAVSTPEGITIGASPEDVTAAYGEDYDAIGQQYGYEDGDCLFSVLFQDGKAISVEYMALTDLLG